MKEKPATKDRHTGGITIGTADAVLKEAGRDGPAGITIGKVAGDDDLSLYVAVIAPGEAVAAHYHCRGTDIYQIIEGRGIMKTGHAAGGRIIMHEDRAVAAGDCFAVPGGMVHGLVNSGEHPLRVIFSCPADHLGANRHFIADME